MESALNKTGSIVNEKIDSLIREMGYSHHSHRETDRKSIIKMRAERQSAPDYSQTFASEQFNNNTKPTSLFTEELRSLNYVFIPKFKNDTFIMPNRVFERGASGKRFYIKMKDSSVCSFTDQEPKRLCQSLHKKEKSAIIEGRKLSELDKIIEQTNGIAKSQRLKKVMQQSRVFVPTSTLTEAFNPPMASSSPSLDSRQRELKRPGLFELTSGSRGWNPVSTKSVSQSFYASSRFGDSVKSMSKGSQKQIFK